MAGKNQDKRSMTSTQYREALRLLGWGVLESARYLGVSRAQGVRYANGGKVPAPTAILLRLLIRLRLPKDYLERLHESSPV